MKVKLLTITIFLLQLVCTKAQNAETDSIINLLQGTWKYSYYSGGFASLPPTPPQKNIKVKFTQNVQDSMDQTVTVEVYEDSVFVDTTRAALLIETSLPFYRHYLFPDVLSAATGIFDSTKLHIRWLRNDTIELTHGLIADDFFYGFTRDTIITTSATRLTKGDSKIKVYPVPADRFIVIDYAAPMMITLLDIQGRPVLQIQRFTNRKTKMSTSAVKAGIYFLRLETEKRIFFQKIVIAR